MENKINIAELLKGCPKGMELDCLLCNSPIALLDVAVNESTYPIKAVCKDGFIHVLTKYGAIYNHDDAKCVIFPKGKTTWEGFQRPAKDGDVVVCEEQKITQMFIVQSEREEGKGKCYFGYDFERNDFFKEGIWKWDRFATEEEKQKLLQAIKNNGYKWNAETKTLDKLIVPKFKVGDSIIEKNNKYAPFTISNIDDSCYYCGQYVICRICYQDNWELVPNKFDINTLKPFDRVLVRDNDEQMWTADMFSFYNEKHVYPFMCVGHYTNQCIPYDKNKHLLGTTDECNDYYKTWK